MQDMTNYFLRRIRAEGPITVADYMLDCLLHPTMGYYTTRESIGKTGDFITAPEISQMFGEMLGLCLAQCWIDQGAPASFALAELGPGRGTLMADILRATRGVPGFHDACQLHLVEASEKLRALQAATVTGVTPTWHDSLSTIPELPLFLVANEFFDALPIRQFLRDGTGWRERLVGIAEDQLVFGLSDLADVPALATRLNDTQDGDMVELCPAGTAIASELGSRITRKGGVAMIVDYGDWRSLGDTFQAVQAHTKVPVLQTPGHSDLTAHVAFEPLAAASGCQTAELTGQGMFLERLGITDRARTLAALNPNTAQDTISAHRRLTHPAEMGTLFKVLALFPENAAPPPGLSGQG